MESSREYFAQRFAESERKRAQIIADIAASTAPGGDVEWLTAKALHIAGLISSSELHATGSPNVLPKGWYYFYVNDQLQYCPTRVFGLEEVSHDEAMVDLYSRGYRWMVVFSDATGPDGDRTFIDIRDFSAASMTENPLTDRDALDEVISMGYPFESLPADIRNGCAAAPQFPPARCSKSERVTDGPPPGWFPDPWGRHEWRWWAGQRWSQHVSTNGRPTTDSV